MLRFYAEFFIEECAKLNAIENKCKAVALVKPIEIAPPGRCNEVFVEVGMFAMTCVEHELTSTASKCGRISQTLAERNMRATFTELSQWLAELRERLEDDLQNELFLHLLPTDADRYEHSTRGWDGTIRRFWKVKHDIEESSKCFSLARYAAAVFHIMLVAEFGVIEVARLFQVEGDKPGWGCLEKLGKLNDKKWADKSPLEQQHAQFLKDLLPLAFAMKDSWRHKLSHVDNKIVWMDTDFSPEVASDIITTTRGFMERLSVDLPK
jgi:hypothetical protein